MANYYSDHPEIGFYLNHPLMARIVELKEKGFADAKEYDYAPVDLGDAIDILIVAWLLYNGAAFIRCLPEHGQNDPRILIVQI